MHKKKKYSTCDPKYYGKGVKNCENTIKGLDKLKEKIKNEN